MLNLDPNYHKGKSRLVFAGQESLNGYSQIGVKFKVNEGFSTRMISRPRAMEINLPDRTLYLSGKNRLSSTLLQYQVDLVVSTKRDLQHIKNLETDMLLFNPIHAPSNLDVSSYKRNGIDVIVDSGGFQLAQGTVDFVDPEDTLTFYNQHASIGMGLDFPSGPAVDAIFYKQNCKLQALNNAYIRQRLNKGVSLAPVVHGFSCKTRQHCLDLVYEQGRDKVIAIAGMPMKRSTDPEIIKQKFDCLARVISQTRKHVLYYHLLGATSTPWLAIMRLLAETGFATSIGGDSVSHRQNAIGGSYNLYPHFDSTKSWIQPVQTNSSAMLPCSCPVCAVVKDARVLRDFRISELHHLYHAANNNQHVGNNVQQYVRGNITRTQLWNSIFGADKKATQGLMNLAFDYFEDVINKGYDKVKPLTKFEGVSLVKSSLFGGSTTGVKKEVEERYRRIHQVYSKYHGKSI